METLEIHAKDFLVKWVHAPDNSVIDWQVKPLKKSINLAIYRKKDDKRPPPTPNQNGYNPTVYSVADDFPSAAVPPSTSFVEDANEPLTPSPNGSNSSLATSFRTRSSSMASVNKFTEHNVFRTKSRSSTFSSNLSKSDLTLLKNYNKLISDELVHGTFQVTNGGMFAFIFDNSFSKTTGKKVYFSSKIIKLILEPPSVRRQSSVVRASVSNNSPERKITFVKGTLDDTPDDTTANGTILRPKNGELLQSVLSKRRRKKLQGFVKRYFVLNFKYGTLSYFKLNDNKLRGQMPIKQSIVSANPKTREIIIDSGMEIWDLKALNDLDFKIWVEAFNQIKKAGERGEFVDEALQDSGDWDDVSVVEELEVVLHKLDRLRLETSYCPPDVLATSISSISKDVQRLLSKLRPAGKSTALGDSVSVYSTNEFFDANEDVDALSSGVVLLDFPNEGTTYKRIDGADEEEQFDASSSSSSEESHHGAATYTEDVLVIPHPTIEEDDDLHPLPFRPVQRDPEIPICDHSPSSFVSFIRKNVGKDLSSIPMPIDMNEPISALQKYAEMFEYCDLVNNALQPSFDDNSGEKILRIAAFAVSYFSSVRAKIRNSRKPFNPLLGETYELVREDFGIRMVSEKVSHKPVIFAFHVESENWTFTFSPAPTQKIWGHSAEIITKGTAKLTVKETGEVFTWNHPSTMLKNILAGEKYSEPSASMTIKSSLGYKAVIEFAKSGMFSGRSEDLTITAYDSSKNKLPYTVSGKWTESLTLKTNSTQKLIWECGELLPEYKKKFGFTKFTGTLNKVTEIDQGLAPTDTRLRPDIKLYEQGNVLKAEGLKLQLEEEQRNRRKDLDESGAHHVAQFFEFDEETSEWAYIKGENSYWNRRKSGNWDGLIKLW